MAQSNFHETFSEAAAEPPSPRSTGFVFAGVAAIVALIWRNDPSVLRIALPICAFFLIVSLIKPTLLKPLNALWFKLALVLHRVFNPVIMFLMFALIMVPFGLIYKLTSDPLRLKRRASGSYWIDRRSERIGPSSMVNQF